MKVAEVGKSSTLRRRNQYLTRLFEKQTTYSDARSTLYQKAEHYLLTDFSWYQ